TNFPISTTTVPQPAGPSAFFITSSIAIVGSGETIIRSNAAGTADFRLFQVTATGFFSLDHLTLSGGRGVGGTCGNWGGAAGVAGSGGAMYNQGQHIIHGCTCSGNQAVGGSSGSAGAGGGGLGGSGGDDGGPPNGGAAGDPPGNGGIGGGGGGGGPDFNGGN